MSVFPFVFFSYYILMVLVYVNIAISYSSLYEFISSPIKVDVYSVVNIIFS
jgi:hypothetical protein